MTYPETSASGIKVLDRVQVASTLNGGRYNGRWATVLNVPSTKNPRYRVQLDKFTRGLEPMDGCLFLSESEIVVPEPGSHSVDADRHNDDPDAERSRAIAEGD